MAASEEIQGKAWADEVTSPPATPGPAEDEPTTPVAAAQAAKDEGKDDDVSAASPSKDDKDLAAAMANQLKVEAKEEAAAGALLSQALAQNLLADIDGSTLSVQQADPNSPLHSIQTWDQLAQLPNTLPIPEPVLQSVRDLNWEKPSKVQESALPMLLKNPPKSSANPLGRPENMIFQSQAGTGKTGAFSIVMLTRLNPTMAQPQSIYVSPTFNLCVQTARVVETMAKHMPGVKISKQYSTSPDLVKRGEKIQAHLIFGTTGMLAKYAKNPARAPFDWKQIRTFVMDEADELVANEKFKTQVSDIRKALPPTCQIMLVSATFEPHVMDFAKDFVPKPVNTITLPQKEVTVDNVKQLYCECDGDGGKFDALCAIYDNVTLGQTLIFVERRDTAVQLTQKLANDGHAAVCIHGKMEKFEQDRILNRFREGKDKVLVATNVLARGIDVKQISMVVNFDLPVIGGKQDISSSPPDPDTYLHRIGRTGRFGKKGTAITLVDIQKPIEMQRLKAIEAHWQRPIEPLQAKDEEELEAAIVCT